MIITFDEAQIRRWFQFPVNNLLTSGIDFVVFSLIILVPFNHLLQTFRFDLEFVHGLGNSITKLVTSIIWQKGEKVFCKGHAGIWLFNINTHGLKYYWVSVPILWFFLWLGISSNQKTKMHVYCMAKWCWSCSSCWPVTTHSK